MLCSSLSLTVSFLHLKNLEELCKLRLWCEIWGVVERRVLEGVGVVDLGSVSRLASTSLVLLCFVEELGRQHEFDKCS